MKDIAGRIFEYLQSEDINLIGDTSRIRESLNLTPIELVGGLKYLYDICDTDLSFTTTISRNGMSFIGCSYHRVCNDVVYSIKSKMNLSEEEYSADEHIRFLYNQFYANVPHFIFDEICDLYFRINSHMDNLKNPTLKEIHVTKEYLLNNNIKEEVSNAIKSAGYCKPHIDGFIWKVYNPDMTPKKVIVEEEPIKELFVGNVQTNNINNSAVKIKNLADNILKELGIKPEKELDEEALLHNLDSLFEKYESMEDWEKIKNSQMFINTWKEIRTQYFDKDYGSRH
ncbi:MAG: hypothetical protein ACRDB0_05485 [Paraclostridium sp.]